MRDFPGQRGAVVVVCSRLPCPSVGDIVGGRGAAAQTGNIHGTSSPRIVVESPWHPATHKPTH